MTKFNFFPSANGEMNYSDFRTEIEKKNEKKIESALIRN